MCEFFWGSFSSICVLSIKKNLKHLGFHEASSLKVKAWVFTAADKAPAQPMPTVPWTHTGLLGSSDTRTHPHQGLCTGCALCLKHSSWDVCVAAHRPPQTRCPEHLVWDHHSSPHTLASCPAVVTPTACVLYFCLFIFCIGGPSPIPPAHLPVRSPGKCNSYSISYYQGHVLGSEKWF